MNSGLPLLHYRWLSARLAYCFRQVAWTLLAWQIIAHRASAGDLSGTVMPLADDDSYSVIPYVAILEDRNNEWNIEDVASDTFFSQFMPAKQSYLNFGYSDSTFWIRLQVRY